MARCAHIQVVFERLRNRLDIVRLNRAAENWWEHDQRRIAALMNGMVDESPRGMYGQRIMTEQVLEEIGRRLARLAAEHCGAAKLKTSHAGWLEVTLPEKLEASIVQRN